MVAHDINHANKDDQAETIVVGEELPTGKDAKLQTTVSVDGTKSSASESASVAAGTKQVVDTVDYTGLIAGSEYTLHGQLMKVNNDGSTTQVAEASNKFTAEAANGQTSVDFGQVKLEAGAKYVVFETATSTNKIVKGDDGQATQHVVKHQDANDKAQAFTTESEKPAEDTTSVKVTKKWTDGAKGESAEVELYANDKATGKKVTLNEGNNWTSSFDNLAKKDKDGNAIKYTVKELTSNYDYKITGDAENGFTITNSPSTATVSVPVVKKWADGAKGEEAVIVLTENGKETDKKITLNEKNDWKGEFTNLKKYDSNGKEITYSVIEKTSNYKYVVTSDGKGGYVVTNWPKDTIIPSIKTTVTAGTTSANESQEAVISTSDDSVSTTVTDHVELTNLAKGSYKLLGRLVDVTDGNKVVAQASTDVSADADKSSSTKDIDFGKVELLPGHTYVVFEYLYSGDTKLPSDKNGELPKNPNASHENPKDKAQTVVVKKNEKPAEETTSVKVTKKWADGAKGEEAVIVLTENGKETDKKITLNEKNDWKGEFTNLKKYDSNGKEITYAVTEKTSNYNYTVEKDGKGGFVVTNSPKNVTPEKETTSVKVTKKWADGAKGESAVVELYANGQATRTTVVLSEANNWTSSFNELAKKDSNGNAIKYTVKEITSNFNYVVSGDATNGYTITNSPSTATVSVPVEKRWADGAKGEEAVIELRENGKETGKTITLNAGNNWKGEFTGLKKFDASGNTNTYDVVEKTSNYNYVVASDGKGGYIVTNKPKDTVVPSIKTIVTADKTSASDSQEAVISTTEDQVTTAVTDHVELSNLAKGSYKLLGRLVDVTDGNKVVAQASTDVSADADKSSSIKDINFGSVALTAGHKYVVFEYLYSEGTNLPGDKNSQVPSNPTASHTNPSDKAQTVVVKKTVKPTENKPEIKTTVTAGKTSASDSQEAVISTSDDTVSTTVTDHVELRNLAKGSYKLVGRLVDVSDGNKVVAQADATVTADKDNYSGSQEIDFGNVTLTAGHKYVVFEYLYPEGTNVPNDKNGELPKNPTASHENPSDKAQTVVVNKTEKPAENKPEIKTTVTAGKTSASDSQEAVISTSDDTVSTTVTDHVELRNLAKGSYKLVGRLVDVSDGNKVVAQADATVTADKDNYSGSQEISFGNVTLTAGHKYVVFEYLYPEGTNVSNDKNGELPKNPTAEHHDENDKAQTVVVEQGDEEKPNKPTTPDEKHKGGDNGNVTPDKNRKGGDSGNVTPSQSGKGSSTDNSLPQTGERAGIAIVGIILVALAVVLFFRKKKTN
ncbi:Cna B-type domain-containing protein [Lactobacillus corticis]|uniref:Gram-positive cocci surface proteins LPxTG domain-containing protein n=1 Tax=Lactobacillus corticis TaxID=2201249 RepID=A0A916VH86_9LACO|nr:Cna B-type domain-containing protein [Lactobacillus corticis]GFZ26357.1 hypothetical protein LCB40_02370 [Lactobacillus corticis]